MAGPQVQIDAAKTQRGLLPAGGQRCRRLKHDPVKSLWSALIFHAVQDAKRTRGGYPTDVALQARMWIKRPTKRTDRVEWERSFECACGWLDLDVEKERTRLLAEIDRAWGAALLAAVMPRVQERAALVMRWSTERYVGGKPAAVGYQLLLPWPADADDADYEDLVGIVHPDPPGWHRKLRPAA